jgi:hypothetical protein
LRRFNSRIPRGAAAVRPANDANWLSAKRVARELDKVLYASGPRGMAIARAAVELRLPTRRFTRCSHDIDASGRFPRYGPATAPLVASGSTPSRNPCCAA